MKNTIKINSNAITNPTKLNFMKNKLILKTYLVISFCCLFQVANAQDSLWSVGPVAGFKAIKSLVIYDFGVQASRTVSIGQRLRLEASYRTSAPNLKQNWGAIPMNMKSNIGSVMFGAGYDWFPYVKSGTRSALLKSLKVTAGVWYLDKPTYDFDASLQNPLVYGDFTFKPEEIGSVATNITTNKVQPYLGVGYDEFYLRKQISFSVNGGFLYQGKPDVTMVATNMLKPTEESAPRLEQNLASYQFAPYIQLLLQYNF
jgi:hypothetical protein